MRDLAVTTTRRGHYIMLASGVISLPPGTQSRVRTPLACGSMVDVHSCLSLLRSASATTKDNKSEKYRCEG
jgi:hypothetical protein